jgi:hypothetical protein
MVTGGMNPRKDRSPLAGHTGTLSPEAAFSRSEISVRARHYKVAVRSSRGELQVIAVWQQLPKHPSAIEHVTFSFDPKRGFEEMIVSLAGVTSADMRGLVQRLIELRCVLDASFFE